MPLQSAIPILAFLDLEETAAFYRKIGFTVNTSWKEYLMCSRDGIEIHLWKCDNPDIPKNTGCYVRVTGVDAIHAEYSELGIIHPNGPLKNHPWNMREFSILDNSGNLIRFGESLV
ncbi:MAG: VOC family protein [Cyclobacteriaceae bacterium]